MHIGTSLILLKMLSRETLTPYNKNPIKNKQANPLLQKDQEVSEAIRAMIKMKKELIIMLLTEVKEIACSINLEKKNSKNNQRRFSLIVYSRKNKISRVKDS